jgi:putative zinc finger protein
MRCQNMQDNLSAYLDGELSQDVAGEIERHVEECTVCRDLLSALRSVSGLVGELPRQTAPQALSEDVQMQLERRMLLAADGDDIEPASVTDRALAQERPPAWPRVAAIAACLFLAAGIGLLLQMGRFGDTSGPGGVRTAEKVSTDKFSKSDRVAMNEQDNIPPPDAGRKKMSRRSVVDKENNRRWGVSKKPADHGGQVSSEQDRATDKRRATGGGAGGLLVADANKPRRQAGLGAGNVASAGHNTLVIETTGDVAMAEKNLSDLFIENGIALTREAEVAAANTSDNLIGRAGSGRRMKQERESYGNAEAFATSGHLDSKDIPKVHTVTFIGRVPVAKATQLAYEIAGKRQFHVTEGRGLFITASELQKTRLANVELRKSMKDRAAYAGLLGDDRAPPRFRYEAAGRAARRKIVTTDSSVTIEGGEKVAAATKAAMAAPAESDESATGSATVQPPAATPAAEGHDVATATAAELHDNDNGVANETDPGNADTARRDERDEAGRGDDGEAKPQRVAMSLARTKAKGTETPDTEAPARKAGKADKDHDDAVAEALKSEEALVEKREKPESGGPGDAKTEEPASVARESKASGAPTPSGPGNTGGDKDDKDEKAKRSADGPVPAGDQASVKANRESRSSEENKISSRETAKDRIRGRNQIDWSMPTAKPEVTLADTMKKGVAPVETEPEEEKMYIVVRLVVRPGPSTAAGTVHFYDAMAAKKAAQATLEQAAKDAEADDPEPTMATEVAPADDNAPSTGGERQERPATQQE